MYVASSSRRSARRAGRAWEDDGATLVVRGGPHRLLPEWAEADAHGQDAVRMGRDRIGRRLTAAGWLAIEGGGGEKPARVRLGERLLEGGRPVRRKRRRWVRGAVARSFRGLRFAAARPPLL